MRQNNSATCCLEQPLHRDDALMCCLDGQITRTADCRDLTQTRWIWSGYWNDYSDKHHTCFPAFFQWPCWPRHSQPILPNTELRHTGNIWRDSSAQNKHTPVLLDLHNLCSSSKKQMNIIVIFTIFLPIYSKSMQPEIWCFKNFLKTACK